MGRTVKCKSCQKYINKKAKICPYCRTKQKTPAAPIIAAAVYFLFFLIMLFTAVIIFPRGEDGNANIPGWYSVFCILFPGVIAALSVQDKQKKDTPKSTRKKLWRVVWEALIEKLETALQRKLNPNNEFRVPKTKGRQEKLARELLGDTKINTELANKSDNIRMFILFYDDALGCLQKLSMLDKVRFRGDPGLDFTRLQNETQWHLCDALNRQKETVISEIKGKYKNSREFQEKQYEYFKYDIEELKPRFSEKTSEFADECLHEIEKLLGIYSEQKNQSFTTGLEGIARIDFMEGHQFEYWCADLLRKIGFINVSVTQGSGDQGVDILAVKDGIKYAIQCKCYSSDLGNKPVQEVNTGRVIYHCQIGAVMTNRHFTQGGKEAAGATGVLLWDRDWIQEKLKEIGE